MPSLYELYNLLTAAERNHFAAHPLHALAVKECREIAYAQTEKHFGFNGHNDQSDAFRHCLWSALLARDIGFAGALEYTLAHEENPSNPKAEKAMDLHNNDVGLHIGIKGGSNDAIIQRCLAALRGGRLRVLDKRQ